MSRHDAVLALLLAILLALPVSESFGDAANSQETLEAPSAAMPGVPGIEAILAISHSIEYTDTRRAQALAVQAVAQARRGHDAKAELAGLLQTGKMARFLNDYPQALTAASEGLALATTTGDADMRGNFYLLLGYVNWNRSDLPAALTNLLAAEKISRAEKDVPLQIAVQSALSLVDARNENPVASLSHLEIAYTLAEQSGFASTFPSSASRTPTNPRRSSRRCRMSPRTAVTRSSSSTPKRKPSGPMPPRASFSPA